MKANIILLAFLGLLNLGIMAQNAQFHWAKGIGINGSDEGNAIRVDGAGNSYICGNFSVVVDFDPGAGVFNMDANNGGGFLCKLDPTGAFVWAKQFGSPTTDATALERDANGNLYITGAYNATADFDPGAGVSNLTPTGTNQDVFVLKLNPSGDFVWARGFGGAAGNDLAYSISVDRNQNVLVSGFFNGTVDFDPGPGTSSYTSAGGIDAFISKFDASGNFLFAKRFGTSTFEVAHGVLTDTLGNIYATGHFLNTVDFDPGVGIFNLTSNGGGDVFICKMDSSGNFLFAKSFGNTSNGLTYASCMDANSNLYLTGYFAGTVDFDPGPGSFTLTGAGSNEIFVLKVDKNGNFIAAARIGGTGQDDGRAIAVDAAGYVYVTGLYKGTADLDPGPGTYNVTSVGNEEVFISRLKPNLTFDQGYTMGGTGVDIGNGIAVGSSGTVFTTGSYFGPADFDPFAAVFTLNNSAGGDVFVQKISVCLNSNATINPTACGSYTSPSGNNTWTASGTYTDAIPNAAGCDSILTINLTITAPATPTAGNNGPLNVGATLNLSAATIPGATYSWTGPGGFTATTQNPSLPAVTLSNAGTYIVTAMVAGCSNTSDSTLVVINSNTSLSGTIRHPNNTSVIRSTTVNFSGASSGAVVTGADGIFSLSGLTGGGNYTLTPSKANDTVTNNGITTLDLVLMQRHILNIDTLNSPFKIIAGDVNGSGSLTTLDIVLTRTVVLQTNLNFSGNLWKMVSSDHVFSNPISPWPFVSTRSYAAVSTQTNQDFFGVKLGDVNWSWNPAQAKAVTTTSLPIYFGESQLGADGFITVPVLADGFDKIAGYQFALKWDPSHMEFVGIEGKGTAPHFSEPGNGQLNVSWNDENGAHVSLSDGSDLFLLRFKARGAGVKETWLEIDGSGIPGEAYDDELEVLGIENANAKVRLTDANALVCHPNPAAGIAELQFFMPASGIATIAITDLNGRHVSAVTLDCKAGRQTYPISTQGLAEGTYFLRLGRNGTQETIKLTVTK